ncbi:MAG: hypothetical protein K0Q46_3165 [Rhodococcus erythropolis]|jgi:hypothetical protein|nr:hypothetical protein [Rhodococcus erythropolis]
MRTVASIVVASKVIPYRRRIDGRTIYEKCQNVEIIAMYLLVVRRGELMKLTCCAVATDSDFSAKTGKSVKGGEDFFDVPQHHRRRHGAETLRHFGMPSSVCGGWLGARTTDALRHCGRTCPM